MNKYQVKGESKIIAGKVQERVGKMTDSPEQRLKDQDRQITGHLRKGMRYIKQAIDGMVDDDGNRYFGNK
jgi:uncharacterized protein YjbJ (UPF0337 family)